MSTSTYAKTYPALSGQPVTQGHADHCAERGHAFHTIAGEVQDHCPRCGELVTSEPLSRCADEGHPMAATEDHCPVCGAQPEREPVVLAIVDRGAIADRRVFDVTVRVAGARFPVTFTGPTHGMGPVFTRTASLEWVRVDSPAQYGETFGPEWLRAYYGPRA